MMNSHRGSNDADAARVRTGRVVSRVRGVETRSQNSQPRRKKPKSKREGSLCVARTDEGTSLTSNLEAEHVEQPLRGHLQGHAPRRSAIVRVGASARVVVRDPLELLAQNMSRPAKRVGAAEHERGGERRRGSRQVHVHAVAEEHRRGPVRLGVAADGARRGDGRREQRQHGERINGFRYRHSTLTETAGRGGCGRGGGTELLCARWVTARDSGPLGASPPISLFRIREAARCVLEASWAARASNRQPRPTEPGTPHRSLKIIRAPAREDKVVAYRLRLSSHKSRPPVARLAGNDTHRCRRRTRRSRSTRRTPPPVAASPPLLPRAPSRSARNIIGTDGHRRSHPRVPPTSSPARRRPRSRSPNSAPPHPANGRATESTSTPRACPSSSPTESSRPRSRSTAWTSWIGSRSAR